MGMVPNQVIILVCFNLYIIRIGLHAKKKRGLNGK